MTAGVLEIMGRDGAGRPTLGLDRPLREALAIYCARRWPERRRKHIEREWDLTPDEARGVSEGTASASIIDKVFKRGGWDVALPILGAVIGHGVGSYFAREAERARHEAVEAAEYERACRQAELVALRSFDPRLARGGPNLDPDYARAESQALGIGELADAEGALNPKSFAPSGRRGRT